MSMASLSAALLVRKGDAKPSTSPRVSVTTTRAVDSKNAGSLPQATKATPPVLESPSAQKGEAQPFRPTSIRTTASIGTSARANRAASLFGSKKANRAAGISAVRADLTAEATPGKKRVHKSVRIASDVDLHVRLVAARRGITQQAVMEAAIVDYMDLTTEDLDCICRPGHQKKSA